MTEGQGRTRKGIKKELWSRSNYEGEEEFTKLSMTKVRIRFQEGYRMFQTGETMERKGVTQERWGQSDLRRNLGSRNVTDKRNGRFERGYYGCTFEEVDEVHIGVKNKSIQKGLVG